MRLFIVIITLITGCQYKSSKVIDRFQEEITDIRKENYFLDNAFPSLLTEENIRNDSFFTNWFSEVLYSFNEPNLYKYKGRGESIRFVWLPTLRNPFLIRLNNFNDTITVSIKRIPPYQNESQKINFLKDTVYSVVSDTWDEYLMLLKDNDFWSESKTIDYSNQTKDGVFWLLECRLSDKYHYIIREEEGDFSSKHVSNYVRFILSLLNEENALNKYFLN
ncbi:hypothetical protein [Gynurincola endophyticus]|uniref:hypothetical protein n=1 Tax=Gynurincola endophyticus TaxID=2479004 RepID=UPI000F8D57C1|nr:hypothetical protein [Gynurincola endophyticus]